MKLLHRLSSVALAAFLSVSIASTATAADDYKLNVGVQTWTLRNMNFDQVVAFAKKHGVTHLQMISKHINPKGDWNEIKRKKKVLDDNGLVCYTFGVNGTSLDKEDNRKLFEFAKYMGCKIVVVEPRDFKIFENLEELVKEYDIKVAIHNHGLTSMYGNPDVVRNVIKHLDKRIGVCLDTGWITAAGYDAAKEFKKYDGRVYDIHLKDKTLKKAEGYRDVYLDVEVGTGDANFKGLFKELKKANWPGVLAIETDNGMLAANPDKPVGAALKFVKANKP